MWIMHDCVHCVGDDDCPKCMVKGILLRGCLWNCTEYRPAIRPDYKPSSDGQAVKPHWITRTNENHSPFDPSSEEDTYICNVCGTEQEHASNYCPQCGVRLQ